MPMEISIKAHSKMVSLMDKAAKGETSNVYEFTMTGKADELVLEDGVRAEGQQTLGALGGIGPQAPAPTGGQDERVQADLS